MTQDRLITPGTGLAGCLFAALTRDTRGRGLVGADLYNHFPASPLFAVSWVFEGVLHRVEDGKIGSALPPVSVSGPQPGPVTSWAPGEVVVLSLGIWPEAWARLTGQDPARMLGRTLALDEALGPGAVREAFDSMTGPQDLGALEAALTPLWRAVRPGGVISGNISDWLRAVSLRAAMGGAGRSLRQGQRRLKRLTGQNRQALAHYAQFEALGTMDRTGPLAELALEAGFADQSHMGRTVKRVSGLSPAALNRAIAEDEAFWAYRLFGQGV